MIGGEYIGGSDAGRTLTIDVWHSPEVGIVGLSEFPGFLEVGLVEAP